MPRLPRKLTGTGPYELAWNELVDFLRATVPLPAANSGGELQTPAGTVRNVNVGVSKSPGMIYRGTYDSTQAYTIGDVVRKQSGTSQGVYVCVKGNPVVAGSSTPPTFPEPADSGGTNTWELLTLGVKTLGVCSGSGSAAQYFNTSDSF